MKNTFFPFLFIILSQIFLKEISDQQVYDMLGREVATLVNEEKAPGIYNVKYDIGHSQRSRGIASGIYFYRMQCGAFTDTKKFVIMK
jgi:hypothetical protein